MVINAVIIQAGTSTPLIPAFRRISTSSRLTWSIQWIPASRNKEPVFNLLLPKLNYWLIHTADEDDWATGCSKEQDGPKSFSLKFMVYGPNDHSITAQQVLVPCPLTMGNSFSLHPLNVVLVVETEIGYSFVETTRMLTVEKWTHIVIMTFSFMTFFFMRTMCFGQPLSKMWDNVNAWT